MSVFIILGFAATGVISFAGGIWYRGRRYKTTTYANVYDFYTKKRIKR